MTIVAAPIRLHISLPYRDTAVAAAVAVTVAAWQLHKAAAASRLRSRVIKIKIAFCENPARRRHKATAQRHHDLTKPVSCTLVYLL